MEAQINIINNINNNKSNIYDLKQLASTSAMFIYYYLNQIIPVRYIKKLVYLRWFLYCFMIVVLFKKNPKQYNIWFNFFKQCHCGAMHDFIHRKEVVLMITMFNMVKILKKHITVNLITLYRKQYIFIFVCLKQNKIQNLVKFIYLSIKYKIEKKVCIRSKLSA